MNPVPSLSTCEWNQPPRADTYQLSLILYFRLPPGNQPRLFTSFV